MPPESKPGATKVERVSDACLAQYAYVLKWKCCEVSRPVINCIV